MPAFMRAYESHAYALLRIVAGFLFLWHGSQMLLDFPVAGPELSPLMLVAGLVELVGGSLVMIGLFAGWAAFVCSGQMAVAYWTVHAPQGLFPIVNEGERAALYCFVFLFIAARGAGIWSVDGARGGR